MTRKKYTYEQRRQFQDLFGRDLHDFWDNFTGFDVIKFDEVAQPDDGLHGRPDKGQSTKDKLQQKWGNEAVKLIMALLGMPTALQEGLQEARDGNLVEGPDLEADAKLFTNEETDSGNKT